MQVTQQNLNIVFQGFQTAFQQGLGQAESQWNIVATRVPSTTGEEKYGWLGKMPGVRKWLGDRHVHQLEAHDYAIKNEDWEQTIGVSRNSIEDDKFGLFAPLFTEMGRAAAAFPDELVYGLLAAAFDTPCYDGQYFFDTDHPVLDSAGEETSVANTDGGSGKPWFLIDDSRALKPLLYQVRKDFDLVRKDKPDDDNVFNTNEFQYGTHGRSNAGFGFWQFAWGSKQSLDKANYATARQSLMGMKGDYGRPLGLRPRRLVVPPSLEGKALEILNAERDAAGATNVYMGTAQLTVVPWLET
jgi:phage major head subunit gpT-like protein